MSLWHVNAVHMRANLLWFIYFLSFVPFLFQFTSKSLCAHVSCVLCMSVCPYLFHFLREWLCARYENYILVHAPQDRERESESAQSAKTSRQLNTVVILYTVLIPHQCNTEVMQSEHWKMKKELKLDIWQGHADQLTFMSSSHGESGPVLRHPVVVSWYVPSRT